MLRFKFYDRKNENIVFHDQLMQTKVVETRLLIDSEEFDRGPWQRDKHEAYLNQVIIGSLCYETKACPKDQNWDHYLVPADLIFLGVVFEPFKDLKTHIVLTESRTKV